MISHTPVILSLKHIQKRFDSNLVLKDFNLSVYEGEFVTLLGSSGCGKTTTLRLIAGLETPDAGDIILEGESMAGQPPEKRNVNTVFQNYALFPHMNVFQNIAYGLKIKKIPKNEIQSRVSKMLKLVQLEGYEKRMPSQLSGGQKQRIAIARALINRPRVLLLDEPLGALDLQLRRQMQLELKHLQKQLGITFIYITHDQEEAINMSDRIAVMREGQIEQIGTPSEIYDDPVNCFVARFVGSANTLSGKVTAIEDGIATLSGYQGEMRARLGRRQPAIGSPASLAIRQEAISIWSTPHSSWFLPAVIAEKSFAGGLLRISALLSDGTQLIITRHGINFDYETGESVFLEWNAQDALLVSPSC